MSAREETTELSETILQIGMKFFPRRYHRFKDLREDVLDWVGTLDWRNNPYDHFLLRREILRHFETSNVHEGRMNVYTFASRDEISAECDLLLQEYSTKSDPINVFAYVTSLLKWRLGFRHGLIQYDRLAAI
jgi:hypothetical protein